MRPRPSVWQPIYRLVKQVPRGCVITYGELAKRLHLRGGARMAGYAMAATPRGSGIPWHRVVAAGGRLAIREPISGLQRKLLESEGVTFHGLRVDMSTHAWKQPWRKAKPTRRRSRAAR
jgi:methylated-DNA-protein-cysteine methyltransferase related protein